MLGAVRGIEYQEQALENDVHTPFSASTSACDVSSCIGSLAFPFPLDLLDDEVDEGESFLGLQCRLQSSFLTVFGDILIRIIL